jgi:hypothetical protein
MELSAKDENEKILKEHIPYTYERYAGYSNQGARRVTIPIGFYFIDPEKVNANIWKEDKKRKGLFYPSKKSKEGREMQHILDSLKSFSAFKLLDMMNIEYTGIGNFSTPFLELAGDTLIIVLDDKFEPKIKGFIEITRKEALKLLEFIES